MSRGETSKVDLRQVYVLREVALDIKKLRKGDVYRLARANKDDKFIDPNEFFLCTKKPEKLPQSGNYRIGGQMLLNPQVGKMCKFTWPGGKR